MGGPSWWWVSYPLMGLLAGFFAGLLGIGAGLILVSLMVLSFNAQGFPPDRVMHLALGTSLATIIFTSLKNIHAHHAHGAVRWDIVRHAAVGLVFGTLAGSAIAEMLRSRALAVVFTLFVVYSAINMALDLKPKPTRKLPGRMVTQLAGALVGIASSLVGAGGGFISIPLMTYCNVPMRQCVATSAAFGLPIAIAGTAGFLVGGWQKDHLPVYSLGYVHLPAMIGIVAGTFVTVPLGARVAHTIPVAHLKRVFAVILTIMAVKMVVSLL